MALRITHPIPDDNNVGSADYHADHLIEGLEEYALQSDVDAALEGKEPAAQEIKYATRDFGVVGDGVTDDFPAMFALAVYAKANPDFEYRFTPEMRIALTSQNGPLDFGAARVRMRGARFYCSRNDTSNDHCFTLGAGADWDDLNVKFTGGAFQRFVMLQGRVGDLAGAKVGRIKLWSATPIGTLTDQFDSAIRFLAGDAVTEDNSTGDGAAPASTVWADVDIGRIDTYNIQYVLNSRISAAITYGWRVGFAKIRGYVLGLKLVSTRGGTVGGFDIQLQTTDADTVPGHNGILLGGAQDMSMGSGIVADSGEHGIRVGGGLDAVQMDSKNIAFGNLIVKRPGQCGFKAWAGWAWIDGLTIASLTVIDCSYNNSPGTNEDGLRLEQVRNANIGPVVVKVQDRATSCYDGIYIAGGQNIAIARAVVSNCARNGLRIERLNGTSAPGGIIPVVAINRIAIDLLASDCGENAVYVNASTLLSGTGATDPGGETTTEGVHITLSAKNTKGIYWRASSAIGCSVKGEVRSLVSGSVFDVNSLPLNVDVHDVGGNRRIVSDLATVALSAA